MELNSFGFVSEVEAKEKRQADNNIRSAFIKANTHQQYLNIYVSNQSVKKVHKEKIIKVKMEIDVDPPLKFHTETKLLLEPIPFSVHSFTLPGLFAGKLHALLCRAWKNRVKGRDWSDFVWYIGKKVKPDLFHLQERLIQTGHWPRDKILDSNQLKTLLLERIQQIDFDQAKKDVLPFVVDPTSVALWSKEFFSTKIKQLADFMHQT